ncbi:MAG: virulence RhuM family protein [Oscillospiraceae bacterium]|nr:virulence RhuM family protein [Oscillospiraceae bacterium]
MSNELKKKGILLMYSYEGTKTYVDVYFQDETFWLTQAGMAELFDCAKSNISMHLKTIFAEEELDEATVMRKFRISELSTKPTYFYNLDAIIAVGYRVNSKKASISHEAAVKKVSDVYAEFRKKQDADYVSEFDRETAKYLKGTN